MVRFCPINPRHSIHLLLATFLLCGSCFFSDAVAEADAPSSITVSGEAGLEGYVAYTERVAPELLARVEQRLGLRAEGPVEIIWVEGLAGLRRVLAESRDPDASRGFERWVAGVALHPEQKVILRATAIRLSDVAEIDSLIAHELAHVVLARIRHPESQSQPVWLHEGLAQWVSERLVFDAPFQLKLARMSGALYSFARLEGEFPEDASGAAIAYQQSESVVRFLVARVGGDRLRAVLERMTRGENFYVAFRRETGASFYDLEAEWLEYIGRFELLPWLVTNSGALFFGLACVGAVGIWFKRRKARQILEMWDEEEAQQGLQGERLEPSSEDER